MDVVVYEQPLKHISIMKQVEQNNQVQCTLQLFDQEQYLETSWGRAGPSSAQAWLKLLNDLV